MTKRGHLAIVFFPIGFAVQPVHAELPAAPLGKQRAASSHLEWEIRDAGHPILGNIRFAFLKTPVETPVGKEKVFSRAYFSCQKGGRFAIELSNAISPDDPKGLRPRTDPRLYCSRPIQPWDEKLVQEELLARWDVNEIGDALAQGFRPFPLRECVSIRVIQEVVLPQSWAQKSAKVEFDLLPYNRELDSIFATCGEVSAYAPVAPAPPPVAAVPTPAPAPVASAPPPKPAPAPVAAAAPVRPPMAAPAPVASATPIKPPVVAPAPAAAPKPATETSAPWQTVRVLASGKTNVRGGPRLESAIVVELAPGTTVLVQRTGTEWWRARSSSGPAFEGYIRQDRLVLQ